MTVDGNEVAVEPHPSGGEAGRNELLRQARLRTPSPSNRTRPMSQRELAEAVTAYIQRTTGRDVAVDRHIINRWENGKRRPVAEYRCALRTVLGVASDEELGFSLRPQPPRTRAIGRALPTQTAGTADEQAARPNGSDGSAAQLVVTPGPAVILASATPELLNAVVPLLAALKALHVGDEPALTTAGTV